MDIPAIITRMRMRLSNNSDHEAFPIARSASTLLEISSNSEINLESVGAASRSLHKVALAASVLPVKYVYKRPLYSKCIPLYSNHRGENGSVEITITKKPAGIICSPNASLHSFSPDKYDNITELAQEAINIPMVIINCLRC